MDLPEVPTDDRHHRSFWADTDTYYRWADTIPRRQSVNQRYRELIRLDAEHEITEAALTEADAVDPATVAERIEGDDLDAGAARVAAVSIQRHCRSGIQDARANGADKAAEKLTDIQNKAEQLLEIE